jgi:hypothetical protein
MREREREREIPSLQCTLPYPNLMISSFYTPVNTSVASMLLKTFEAPLFLEFYIILKFYK